MSLVKMAVGLASLVYAASAAARLTGTISAMNWDTSAFGSSRLTAQAAAIAVALLLALLCLHGWRAERLAEQQMGGTDDADRDEALRQASHSDEPGATGRPMF